MVLDKSGNILYRREEIQENDLADKTDSQEVLEAVQKNYVSVSSISRDTGWEFYLYKTRKSIEQSVYQMLLTEIPLIIGCVLIIFILGLVFSRLFTRKIEQLTRNMDQVNSGSSVKMTAAMIDPRKLPMPPNTTNTRIMMDILYPKFVGVAVTVERLCA